MCLQKLWVKVLNTNQFIHIFSWVFWTNGVTNFLKVIQIISPLTCHLRFSIFVLENSRGKDWQCNQHLELNHTYDWVILTCINKLRLKTKIYTWANNEIWGFRQCDISIYRMIMTFEFDISICKEKWSSYIKLSKVTAWTFTQADVTGIQHPSSHVDGSRSRLPIMAMLASKIFTTTKRSWWLDQESNTYPTKLAWHMLVRGSLNWLLFMHHFTFGRRWFT